MFTISLVDCPNGITQIRDEKIWADRRGDGELSDGMF